MDVSRGIQRLFADDYSSSGQVSWKQGRRGADPEYWADDFLGQLRFDLLVSAAVVIPDSHIFDGAYFLTTSPSDLAAALGRSARNGADPQAPLEVRGRGAGLADSLATLLVRDGSDTLNAFVFKTIEDAPLRAALAEELGRTPAEKLERALAREYDVPAAVASVVRDAIQRVDSGEDGAALVDQLEDGWRRWLDEERWVSVETWPIHRSFDIAASLKLEPPVSERLNTRIGRDVLADVLGVVASGSQHRADVSKVLAEPRAVASAETDEAALADFDAIDTWYSRGRYRALAIRHGCSCVLADPPRLPPVSAAQAVLREIRGGGDLPVSRVELPQAVLRRLADMADDEFRALVRRHRRGLRRWWDDGETDGLKEVASAIGNVEPATNRKRLGVLQLLPLATPPLAYGLGRALKDHAAGAAVATEVGALILIAEAAHQTEHEQEQARILEALTDRARDDSHSPGA